MVPRTRIGPARADHATAGAHQGPEIRNDRTHRRPWNRWAEAPASGGPPTAYRPPGTYRLRILDPTNAHTAGYYDHAAAYATATPLTVAAGQNLTDRNTTLDPTA